MNSEASRAWSELSTEYPAYQTEIYEGLKFHEKVADETPMNETHVHSTSSVAERLSTAARTLSQRNRKDPNRSFTETLTAFNRLQTVVLTAFQEGRGSMAFVSAIGELLQQVEVFLEEDPVLAQTFIENETKALAADFKGLRRKNTPKLSEIVTNLRGRLEKLLAPSGEPSLEQEMQLVRSE